MLYQNKLNQDKKINKMPKYKSAKDWYNSPEYKRTGWDYDYYKLYCARQEGKSRGLISDVTYGLGSARQVKQKTSRDLGSLKSEFKKWGKRIKNS